MQEMASLCVTGCASWCLSGDRGEALSQRPSQRVRKPCPAEKTGPHPRQPSLAVSTQGQEGTDTDCDHWPGMIGSRRHTSRQVSYSHVQGSNAHPTEIWWSHHASVPEEAARWLKDQVCTL